MERKTDFSDETVKRAQELLAADVEMLHEYPANAQNGRCLHCEVYRGRTRFGEECPALLRCALELVRPKARRPATTAAGQCYDDARERSEARDHYSRVPRAG